MKTIVLGPGAAKALDKVDAAARESIANGLHEYAMRGVGDVKAMAGANTARLRVGDYRVIFDEQAERIVLLALGHR